MTVISLAGAGMLPDWKPQPTTEYSNLARALKARDYTLKDIAAVTGYSFQRIGQSLDHNQLTRA